MGKSKHRLGLCNYCGKEAILTRDHVIPRVLFGEEPLPSHPRPPIVYACNKCNNELKSDDDALLKDLHSVDYQVWQSGRANQIFASTRRAVRQNESELAKPVKDARLVWVMVNGLMVPAYEMKLPLDRVERVIATIVRGLSIYYAGRRLPEDAEFVVQRWYDVSKLDDTIVNFVTNNALYQAIGDGSVFDCRYMLSEKDPVLSLWILRFYSSAFYSVSTHALGTAPTRAFVFRTA